MNSSVCAVCGQPSRYIFAFPSGTASAGVIYDGAPVCSAECARELRKQREQDRNESESTQSEGAAHE